MIGLHQLIHPQPALQSSSRKLHENNVIRIGAKAQQHQNQPVLLSSTPLASSNNNNSSSSRGHSRSQARQQVVSSQQHMSAAQSHHLHSSSTNHHYHHLTQRDINSDKVLLIVNDDHIKGGGVPVIGRRVASKSASAMRSPPLSPPVALCYSQQVQLENSSRDTQPFNDFSLHSPPSPPQPLQAPVVGRRSHRLLQQRATNYQYEYHDSQQRKQERELLEVASAAHEAHLFAKMHNKTQQQPVHLLAIRPTSSSSSSSNNKPVARITSNSSGRHPRPSKYPSVSLMNVAAEQVVEYNLPPMQEMPMSQHKPTSKRSNRVSSKTQKAPQIVMASASCSSLCDSANQQPEMAHYELCCASCHLSELDTAPTCLEPCCNAAYEGPLVRTASCQQVSPNCCASKSLQTNERHQVYLSSSNNVSQPRKMRLNAMQCSSSGSHSVGSSKNHLHHQHQHRTPNHHSCQANGSTNGCASSYKHLASGSSNHGAANAQPMLISGRNILPVHPKPNVQYLQSIAGEGQIYPSRKESTALKMSAPKADSPEAAAVSQMYESLAAELKAKLGDPNMGPILLPPKDYDTMSRKQGKLSGIELRRSTNPALVGPTANSSVRTAAGGSSSISEESITHQPGESRNSITNCGRTKLTVEEEGSQCSRSNSSSGLGSISIGMSSPNLSPSSKISSSEDMHQSSSNSILRQAEGNSNRLSNNQPVRIEKHQMAKVSDSRSSSSSSPVERKNGSPDNCSASDSGHSGSGRLDSTISSSNEEHMQKMSHHRYDNNDYFPGEYRKCQEDGDNSPGKEESAKGKQSQMVHSNAKEPARGKGIHNYNPSRVSDGSLWNGRVEIPLKVNIAKNTYLATKQIIY